MTEEILDLVLCYPDGSEVKVEMSSTTKPEEITVERLGQVHGCVRIKGRLVARWPLTSPFTDDLEPLTTIAETIRKSLVSIQGGADIAVHWVKEETNDG